LRIPFAGHLDASLPSGKGSVLSHQGQAGLFLGPGEVASASFALNRGCCAFDRDTFDPTCCPPVSRSLEETYGSVNFPTLGLLRVVDACPKQRTYVAPPTGRTVPASPNCCARSRIQNWSRDSRQPFGMDEERMLETPPRKRPRPATPSSSSSSSRRHPVNKRFCPDQFPSLSPRTVRFEPAQTADNDGPIGESDIPESPMPDKRTSLDVLLPLATPLREIDVPFERLNIKSSVPKKNTLATPVRGKVLGGENARSVKKSAKKTPGSAKANKPRPFRIQVS